MVRSRANSQVDESTRFHERSQLRMLSSLLFSLHRSFMFELKQQVLSGALDEAIDSQTSVARLLGALQG